MKVELISLSKPSAITDCLSAEELIAYTARVSNPGNQNNNGTSAKLLRYLIKNGHWSPFEMAHMVLSIETTRDIARQILRHRSFSFQEFSQRYAVATEFSNPREARLQDAKNRQNSISSEDRILEEEWSMKQREVMRKTEEAYQWALSKGIAKEQARVVLPEGLTMSKIYMGGTIRSWIHYIDTRIDAGTQKEHRKVAEQALVIFATHFPSLASYWTEKQ